MRKMNLEETREVNAGSKKYKCRYCGFKGSYWDVIVHAAVAHCGWLIPILLK